MDDKKNRSVTLELDEYERDNLLWLIESTRRTHNTGDWWGQIRYKLKLELGKGQPNQDEYPIDYKHWYEKIKKERDLLLDESIKIHHEERPVRTENRLLKHENEALKAEIARLKTPSDDRMKKLYP